MDSTLQLIINIGAGVSALAAILGFPLTVIKIWPVVKRWVRSGEFMESLPETLQTQNETLLKQDQVLAKITAAVNRAVQQVQNSHVTNLRDDVDEVIGKVDSLHDKLDDHLRATQQTTTTINVNPGSIT